MNKSSFELYSRNQIGKVNINWQGFEPNEQQTAEALGIIDLYPLSTD